MSKRKIKMQRKTIPKKKVVFEEKKDFKGGDLKGFKKLYVENNSRMFIILVLLTLFSIGSLLFNHFTNGDALVKDVSLAGGISITVNPDSDIDPVKLEESLKNEFKSSLSVREMKISGENTGIIIESSEADDEEQIIKHINDNFVELSNEDYNVQSMGSSLGQGFFTDMLKSLVVAFLFMGAVFFFYFGEKGFLKWAILILAFIDFILLVSVADNLMVFWIGSLIICLITCYIYFRYNLPTIAALISAFLDIFITLGIVSALRIPLTSGGIAAFLMLIGYSIDSSILLSTKMLKHNAEKNDGLFAAMSTGLTMSAAGIAAMGVSFLFTNNSTLKQIMLIIVIGLFVDVLTTWIGNVYFLERFIAKKTGEK